MPQREERHPSYFPCIVLGVTFTAFFAFVELMMMQRFLQTQYYDLTELFFLSGLAILPILICIIPLILFKYRWPTIFLSAIPITTFGVVLLGLDVIFAESIGLKTLHVFLWGVLWGILFMILHVLFPKLQTRS